MIQFTMRDKTSFATFCWILWPSSELKQIIDSPKGEKKDNLSVYSSNVTSRAKVAKKYKRLEKNKVTVPIFGLFIVNHFLWSTDYTVYMQYIH